MNDNNYYKIEKRKKKLNKIEETEKELKKELRKGEKNKSIKKYRRNLKT
jgi:hypothetical protein